MASDKTKYRSGPNITDAQRNQEPVRVWVSPGYKFRLDKLVKLGGYGSRGPLLEKWIEDAESAISNNRRETRK